MISEEYVGKSRMFWACSLSPSTPESATPPGEDPGNVHRYQICQSYIGNLTINHDYRAAEQTEPEISTH